MQQMDTIMGTVTRAAREALNDLSAAFAQPGRREGVLAYLEVREPEELSEAEHRAALIRERMRRQGLLR